MVNNYDLSENDWKMNLNQLYNGDLVKIKLFNPNNIKEKKENSYDIKEIKENKNLNEKNTSEVNNNDLMDEIFDNELHEFRLIS